MNKTALGTIIGAALIGLAKSKGSKSSSLETLRLETSSYHEYLSSIRWDLVFERLEQSSEQQSSEQQSSEQQSSEQQSSEQQSSSQEDEIDIEEIGREVEGVIHEICDAVMSMVSQDDSFASFVEPVTWRDLLDEYPEVQVGFVISRKRLCKPAIALYEGEDEFFNMLSEIQDNLEETVADVISNIDWGDYNVSFLHASGGYEIEVQDTGSKFTATYFDQNGNEVKVEKGAFESIRRK